jgi:hypothetical protein
VRCVEAAEVKKHIERMQARQNFYVSGQSNQEGGAVYRREALEIVPYHQTKRYIANPSLDELIGSVGSSSVVSDSQRNNAALKQTPKIYKPVGGSEENMKPVTPPPSKPPTVSSNDKNKGSTTMTSGGTSGKGNTMKLTNSAFSRP